jgi:hypothetical protein
MIARILVKTVLPFYKRNTSCFSLPFIAFSSTKHYNNKMEDITAKVEQVTIGTPPLTQRKRSNSLPSPSPKERSRSKPRLKEGRRRRNPKPRSPRPKRRRRLPLRTRTKWVPSSSVKSTSAWVRSPNAGRYLLPHAAPRLLKPLLREDQRLW